MILPHIIDYYYGGDDSILWNTAKLCVVVKENYLGTFEKFLTIRRIHHFGYNVWLGKEEVIKAFAYEKLEKNIGARCIMTVENEFIVPRCITSTPSTIIALYNKPISYIKDQKILMKELVLIDNKPKLIDYKFEVGKYNSFEDMPRGTKGRFLNTKNKKGMTNEVIIF